MKPAQLQDGTTFLADLRKEIAHAKKRVWINVMIFEISPQMNVYIRLLCDAAKRGVDVRLTVDWITERYYGTGLDVYPTLNLKILKRRKQVYLREQAMFATLKNAGVHLTIDYKPNILGKIFILGRHTHNKIFLIDNVAWVGGVNLIKDPENFVDFMVKLYNPELINVLEKYIFKKLSNDTSHVCDDDYSLLMDSGKKGSSLIYQKTLQVTQESTQTIVLVSQMLPDTRLLYHLLEKSLQGVRVTLIISSNHHNIFTKFPFRYYYIGFRKKIKGNKQFILHESKHRIHAKLLLVDNAKAIFGSHNFESWNTLVGVEETCFFTTDRKLIQQLDSFWRTIKG